MCLSKTIKGIGWGDFFEIAPVDPQLFLHHQTAYCCVVKSAITHGDGLILVLFEEQCKLNKGLLNI